MQVGPWPRIHPGVLMRQLRRLAAAAGSDQAHQQILLDAVATGGQAVPARV